MHPEPHDGLFAEKAHNSHSHVVFRISCPPQAAGYPRTQSLEMLSLRGHRARPGVAAQSGCAPGPARAIAPRSQGNRARPRRDRLRETGWAGRVPREPRGSRATAQRVHKCRRRRGGPIAPLQEEGSSPALGAWARPLRERVDRPGSWVPAPGPPSPVRTTPRAHAHSCTVLRSCGAGPAAAAAAAGVHERPPLPPGLCRARCREPGRGPRRPLLA
jgi:hypothetical protein